MTSLSVKLKRQIGIGMSFKSEVSNRRKDATLSEDDKSIKFLGSHSSFSVLKHSFTILIEAVNFS